MNAEVSYCLKDGKTLLIKMDNIVSKSILFQNRNTQNTFSNEEIRKYRLIEILFN